MGTRQLQLHSSNHRNLPTTNYLDEVLLLSPSAAHTSSFPHTHLIQAQDSP
ncbi:hypothetical protein P7K49_024281 [Saguinus oedipus]|uniref:Uncharacterized protein n=1 Tax=Saguinus oedipus TaxID=9490 RepID=A0ABQ9UPU1_SAGOE|nr:hypothetical protein P7K49_024281 [Saguinus oedipus]